ncbi:regulator of (H+)-ATPase in vacuolar membrane [Fusarium equiseti]|uniref:Regulator of (H+)-ATPase in vacuolar membrane n=1 Tax=Fusarium equiseti TaxID=61235 RepID=A0ABQ8R4S8_FUSEQ|nr:regulator of (H+)-ATPase in vacuolar membrane [Fusarium equiseti]
MSSDFSQQLPNATSPAASMSPAVQRSASPSEDGRSSIASRTPSSQEPYYSNEDIATLHAVVVAAQELLDSAPEPKPLPAAALFKAYDAVLPSYGIDPDSDHHLSTFVFRVGGEQGENSLLDKFQSILNRMGIVLEFGDNTTVSIRTSASVSPAASLASCQSNEALHQKVCQKDEPLNRHPTAEVATSQLPSSPQSPSPSPPRLHNHQHDEQGLSETDDEDGDYEEMRKAVVSSAMNRWRSLVANRRAQPAQRIPSFPSIPEEASADVRNFEAQSHGEGSAVTARPTVTSVHMSGESHNQNSRKEFTDACAMPLSTHSLIHRPFAVLNNAIRPTTSLIHANAQQAPHDEDPSHHNDEVPQSSRERPLSGLEETKEAPPSLSHDLPVHSPTIPARSNTANQNEDTIVHHSTAQEGLGDTPPQQVVAEDSPSTPGLQVDLEKEHNRLLKRASRAREIYLASKVFNHWADRTARRLERDAVARRHMIRFRYFRPWSQAPALREPATDHMRAAVVIKKWQRIATQERNLQEITRITAQAYQVIKVQRALDCWSCHRLAHVGRRTKALRSRSEVVLKWVSQASHDESLQHAIRTQSGVRLRMDAVHQWQNHRQKENQLLATSRRIGEIQHSFAYLREWWDQAETRRKAIGHRQQVIAEKVSSAFNQWNLRARAQAFQWRCEYLQVGRAFDRWLQCADQDGDMGRRAEEYYEGQAKTKVLRGFWRLQYASSQMIRLEGRARLYLGATTVLRTFDRTIKNRKNEDKQSIKRYLMARYTQVSSARKKRNFFSAIDRWKAFVMEDRAKSDTAQELLALKVSHQVALTIDTWKGQVNMHHRHVQSAELQHARGWLEVWKVHTSNLDQQDTEAWQLWAVAKQRQCLKSWSIASLQQSGQAHTALEVQKKHERERRNRVLQHWKQRDDRTRLSARGSRPHPNSVPAAWPRGSWRMISGRRSVVNRSDRGYDYSSAPLETPTRWTGQPFSMSTIMPPGSMAPLREANENDEAFSGDDDDGELPLSPSLRPASRGPAQFSSLPSTTPMAPVPSHLERGTEGQNNESDRGFAVRGTTPRRSRMPRFESIQAAQGLSRQIEVPVSEGLRRSELLQQPLAGQKSFGFKPINGRPVAPRTSSSDPNSSIVGSKSVGVKPSDMQSAPLRPNAKFTPATRSVRIQSPRTFSATPHTRQLRASRSDQMRGRAGVNL